MSVFPVYCTAEIPVQVAERFLSEALAGSNKLAPGSEPALAIVTTTRFSPSIASQPRLQPFSSPFLGQSVEEISRELDGATFFAILDGRSMEDETALLATCDEDGTVQTARVTFNYTQSLLVSLDIATLGFGEIQHIATSSGGVYGRNRETPQRGAPAPRKRLGRWCLWKEPRDSPKRSACSSKEAW
ncbi:hypothetical protein F4819DRAFT_462736 [Hypoxylon fuscum]|nr:hypothetical protein F4819DRAFT_462736 [Hypoxylon fuscum]